MSDTKPDTGPGPDTAAPTHQPGANENPLVILVCNIALPAMVLYKLSRPERLGPMGALIAALAFPIGFFLFDFSRRKKINWISVIGFASILLTGSFGLLHVDGHWFAFKEATMPTLMGIAVIASLWTKTPLVRTLLYNDKVIDVARVDRELTKKGNHAAFNKLLVGTTYMLAASFLLSAALNFTLASSIIKSPAGSVEFNQELGKMTALSYPVVVAPCMIMMMLALWRLLHGIKKMTGLDLEAIFKNPPDKKKA